MWPRSKKNLWTPDNIPISYPYITASVFLAKNPLTTHNSYDIIKSTCNNVFCSYNKTKYDHNFYLNYNKDHERWTKTLQSIKQGNMRIYISGFYKGHSPKDERNPYHLIQITELDFESRFNNNFNTFDDDDDDDLFFKSPSFNKSSEKTSTLSKKHNLSTSESSETSVTSSEKSDSSIPKNKKRKKTAKKKKISTNDKSTKIKHELSYEELLKTNTEKNSSPTNTLKQPSQYNYYNPNLPPPPYYYPQYYHPPSHDYNKIPDLKDSDNTQTPIPIESNFTSESSNSKDKRIVQFDLPSEDLQSNSNDMVESSDNKKSTRAKKTKSTKTTKT